MSLKMKISRKRLLGLLCAHGFFLGFKTRSAESLTYIRPSAIEDLYESIIVESQGRHGEAVYASIGVSVTKTVMFKVLGDVRVLGEIAEDLQRGWTIILNDERGREWERRLEDIGPSKAAQWAVLRGPKVLEDTREARVAVARYISKLEQINPHSESLAKSRDSDESDDVRKEIDRMLSSPGGVGAERAERAYRLAYHTLLTHSREVECGRSYFGQSPAEDLGLLKRVHILADRLLSPEEMTAREEKLMP